MRTRGAAGGADMAAGAPGRGVIGIPGAMFGATARAGAANPAPASCRGQGGGPGPLVVAKSLQPRPRDARAMK